MAWKKTGRIREGTAGRKLMPMMWKAWTPISRTAGDPHQHEGHGQQDGVLHHPAAAAVGTLGVCIAQQGDDAGLKSGEGDEEEGLHLVIQAQDRHGVIGKAGQDHVQGHDQDREPKLHEDGGKSQPVHHRRIGAEHPDGGRLPESGDNNERRQHLA